ncbi:MAG: polymer-forming cytoskeletal protein [Acidobacteriia bacterium]|nr:polymer-forming cytoskeletal protein [Terriglobia bacterium]
MPLFAKKTGRRRELAQFLDDDWVGFLEPGIEVEGNMRIACGMVRLNCHFKGEITCEGMLVVAEQGEIEGNIQAKQLSIAGKVKGSLPHVCPGARKTPRPEPGPQRPDVTRLPVGRRAPPREAPQGTALRAKARRFGTTKVVPFAQECYRNAGSPIKCCGPAEIGARSDDPGGVDVPAASGVCGRNSPAALRRSRSAYGQARAVTDRAPLSSIPIRAHLLPSGLLRMIPLPAPSAWKSPAVVTTSPSPSSRNTSVPFPTPLRILPGVGVALLLNTPPVPSGLCTVPTTPMVLPVTADAFPNTPTPCVAVSIAAASTPTPRSAQVTALTPTAEPV